MRACVCQCVCVRVRVCVYVCVCACMRVWGATHGKNATTNSTVPRMAAVRDREKKAASRKEKQMLDTLNMKKMRNTRITSECLPHTHTHTRTHAHARAHTHTHTHTTHTHTHMHTPTHTRIHRHGTGMQQV